MGEGVVDLFSQYNGDYDGEDVGQGVGEFEYDDDDGDGEVGYVGEGGGSVDDGVGVWCDVGNVGFVVLEEEEVWGVLDDEFYENVDCVVDEGVDGYGWEDDVCGDLEIEGYGCKEEVEYGGEEEKDDSVGGGSVSFVEVNGVVEDLSVFDEEVGYQFCGLDFYVEVWVVDEGGEECDGEDLYDRVGELGV